MNNTKRFQLLTKGQEETSKEDKLAQAERDELQLQADILETKSKISKLGRKLVQQKSAAELSPLEIIETQTDLNGYKLGLVALEELKKELFDDTEN